MLAALAIALLLTAAAVVLGLAILRLLGVRHPHPLAAVTGFAALVVLAPFLIRLPARATTATILITLLIILALAFLLASTPRAGAGRRSNRHGDDGDRSAGARRSWRPWRGSPRSRTVGPEVAGDPLRGRPATGAWAIPVAATVLTIALASLPFLFNEQFGVLGEGIYTNDHAAQLYWADWLQHGTGPEPDAVGFGYPVGPQALAAVAAEATGADLVEAFDGLLLAIPALTALTALALLGGLPPGRRVLAASLGALPYLAASFLAQSAFKETAMALFLVGLAVAMRELGGRALPRRALAAALVALALAAVLAYSVPGLAWIGLGLAIWLALELVAGRRPIPLGAIREAIGRHRIVSGAGLLALVALAAVAVGPALSFFDRIEAVQASVGRLSSPVFPGEALGVWPEGDFRLVRGEVGGAIPAALAGFAALAAGLWSLVRRGEAALLAALGAAAAVYAGARLFAQIHVEAKALAVMAPLVMIVALGALLAPAASSGSRWLSRGRLAFGVAFAVAALASTLLALRAAPVGFDDRAAGLERIGERIDGASVAFLGLDRAAAYRLRDAEARSPGGYVPPRVNARSRKPWRQGRPIDFDTLSPRKLDGFDYAVTTAAAYQSTAPPNMRLVDADSDYLLWRRTGPTPLSRVLPGEGGAPGEVLDCERRGDDVPARGRAVVLGRPVLGGLGDWTGGDTVAESEAAPGQEGALLAPTTATQTLELGPGRWLLSLQYHSQSPLEVEAAGAGAELPPSLEGMYLDGAGRGAFWPAGEVVVEDGPPQAVTVTVRAAAPSGLQDALGVERRVWLGRLAASPATPPRVVPAPAACSRYVDRVLLPR